MPALATEPTVIALRRLVDCGIKRTLWLIVGALLAHGVFDLVHGSVIANPGVPE